MKKKLTLRLIESNDKPQVDNIVLHPEDGYGIIKELNFEDKVITILFPNLRQLQTDRFKLIKPIAISNEEIKVGDWCVKLNQNKFFQSKDIAFLNSEYLNSTDVDDVFKIELLPENFSLEIKQAIVDGKLKDGDELVVSYDSIPQHLGEPMKQRLRLDSNSFAIISVPEESIKERVDKALQLECKTTEDVLSKMYAKAHTRLEYRPSANDGNYNYIHQIDTLNLIEETVKEVDKIMYSKEEVLGFLHMFVRDKVIHISSEDTTDWFEGNKKK